MPFTHRCMFLALLIFIVFLPTLASVGISPAVIEREMTSPKVKIEVTVINRTDHSIALQPTLMGLGQSTSGAPILMDFHATGWALEDIEIQIDPDLPPQTTGIISLSLNWQDQPNLYAALVVETSPVQSQEGVAVQTRLVSLLLLHRDQTPEVQITELVEDERTRIQVENTGLSHARVRVEGSGTPAEGIVLPGYTRVFLAEGEEVEVIIGP